MALSLFFFHCVQIFYPLKFVLPILSIIVLAIVFFSFDPSYATQERSLFSILSAFAAQYLSEGVELAGFAVAIAPIQELGQAGLCRP